MRDNFYHWLAVAIGFAIFSGAATVRFVIGEWGLYDVVMGAVICGISTAGAVRSYQRDNKISAAQREQAK